MTKTTHCLYPVRSYTEEFDYLTAYSAGNAFKDIYKGDNFKPVFAWQKKAIVCEITEL